MPNTTLESFISDCEDQAAAHGEPADIVRAITPLMQRRLCGSRDFLKPEHFQSEPNHYALNLVYAAEGTGLSLYTLVWLPGQGTPVHDHGNEGLGIDEGL